jgi:hypothetical protein
MTEKMTDGLLEGEHQPDKQLIPSSLSHSDRKIAADCLELSLPHDMV